MYYAAESESEHKVTGMLHHDDYLHVLSNVEPRYFRLVLHP
jgi:hypothetical protein